MTQASNLRSSRPLPGRSARGPARLRPLLCGLAACTLGHAGPAVASAGIATDLKAVTVSASLNQTAVADMPLHTTVITREDIDASPAQTLDQLLRTVPGFNFSGVPAAISDPTGQQTRMRGLGNAKVLVLLDGIPVIDPFYLTTQFHKVALADVDHIEVIRGGSSSLWGSMAVAGLVDIVTRRPAGNAGRLTVGAGDHGTAGMSWSQDLKVSEALALNLAVDRYRTAGYLTTPAPYRWKFPRQHATSARDTNVALSAYFRLTGTLDGFAKLGEHTQDQHIGYTYGRNLQKNPDAALGLDEHFGRDRSLSWRAWAQDVHFTKYNGATCYAQPDGTCQNSNARNQAVSDDVMEYYSQYGDQHYREQGTSLTYSTGFDAYLDSLQAGVTYRHLSARDAESFFATPTADPATPQVLNATGYGQGAQTFGGVFVQARFSPLGPLQVTLSGRYDDWRNTGQVHTLTKASTGATGGGALPSSRKSAFDPGVGLHLDLSDTWSLRAAGYKAFRAPGFNNTTRSYGVGPTTVANPDLGAETMTGWEGGTDYRGDRVTLGATYFHYVIANMIATYRVASAKSAPAPVLRLCSASPTTPDLAHCGGSANYYTNDQDGVSRGIELEGRWELSPSLRLGAYATYTDTVLTQEAAAITTPLHVQLEGIPHETGALDATWQASGRLRLYAQALYIGPVYIDETSTPGVRHAQGGNVVFNASASYAASAALELSASVTNAFDKDYSENAYTVTQPWKRTLSQPRTVYLAATFRY